MHAMSLICFPLKRSRESSWMSSHTPEKSQNLQVQSMPTPLPLLRVQKTKRCGLSEVHSHNFEQPFTDYEGNPGQKNSQNSQNSLAHCSSILKGLLYWRLKTSFSSSVKITMQDLTIDWLVTNFISPK